jgi:hypothetical protein
MCAAVGSPVSVVLVGVDVDTLDGHRFEVGHGESVNHMGYGSSLVLIVVIATIAALGAAAAGAAVAARGPAPVLIPVRVRRGTRAQRQR